MRRHYKLQIVLAGLLLAIPVGAARAQQIEVPPQLELLSDAEADARLSFLQERLDAGQTTAKTWQYGWTGIFSVGAVASTAQAIMADDGDERIYNIVGAVKSIGATRPDGTRPAACPPRRGADARGAGRHARRPPAAAGRRRAKLAINSERADTRYSWRRHLEGVTTNLIGGAVIWGFGDSRDALLSVAVRARLRRGADLEPAMARQRRPRRLSRRLPHDHGLTWHRMAAAADAQRRGAGLPLVAGS